MKSSASLAIVTAMLLLAPQYGVIRAALAAEVPELPGITSPDESPEGCVSCHKDEMRLDKKLAALKHRKIDKVAVIPDDCKTCHVEDEGLESIAMIAHSMHYAMGSKSDFVTRHGGSCLNCHAMATGSGEVTVKSGAKNW